MDCEAFRCPECLASGSLTCQESASSLAIRCDACGAQYPSREGRPVLIAPSNALFDRNSYLDPAGNGIYTRRRRWCLPSPSVNLSQTRILQEMGRRLRDLPGPTVLIVGSGRQRDLIARALMVSGSKNVELICTDVDVSADVDLYCDAHRLPFASGIFDGVITTAVLEHVLYPETVAGEIMRVIKLGGLLYSELPFLQQVHEGAYDFTRYTLSGHRRLFNGFREIEAGTVAGPGTVLVWALEHFAASLWGGKRLGLAARALTRVAFFWLKYVDKLLGSNPSAIDSASCTFIFGERIHGSVPDGDIIKAYRGTRSIKHV